MQYVPKRVIHESVRMELKLPGSLELTSCHNLSWVLDLQGAIFALLVLSFGFVPFLSVSPIIAFLSKNVPCITICWRYLVFLLILQELTAKNLP